MPEAPETPPYPTIRPGDGFARQRPHLKPAIQRVQRLLHVGADGFYGKGTAQAVEHLQHSYGLVSDGVVRLPLWLLLEHLHTQIPMTQQQLQTLVKSADRAEKYHRAILETWRVYDISTPLRQAHFLAQVLHETAGLYYIWEIWGPNKWQVKYEPPHAKAYELGNNKPGDGYRFRGWGLIQLTGRSNVQAFCEHLGITVDELEAKRDDAMLQAFAAGYYWQKRRINVPADRDDIRGVTKLINTALLHLDERRARLVEAKTVLGLLIA